MTILQGSRVVSEGRMRMRNVGEVVERGLCTGCGTCVGICPSHSLEMGLRGGILVPGVDAGKCTDCGLCVKSCPGFSLDMAKLNAEVFGRQPVDEVVGNFSECYVGHSTDERVNSACSSGGVIDQLLICGLESGVVDGAVVARMKGGSPLEPEPFVARSKGEVLSASRSKYCPVAVGVVLERLRRERGKFGVVGLPCHIHGVRKAESAVPGLKEKVVLHVGLFCGHTVNFEGTEFLLEKLGVNKRDVARLFYRGNSWPDSLVVELKDGREVRVRFNRGWRAYWNVFSPFFFTPFRCLMCPDQFNELADVSVGDAWLQELRGRKAGESVVIVRTAVGRQIVEDARRDGFLSLIPVSLDKVKESQAFSLDFKKMQYAGRMRFFAGLGYGVPNVDYSGFSVDGFLSRVGGLLSYLSFRVSSSRRLRRLLVNVPFGLFRVYFGLFKCVFLLSSSV